MAQSIEEIKENLSEVGPVLINGQLTELSDEEKEETLNTWAENELARQLAEEESGVTE